MRYFFLLILLVLISSCSSVQPPPDGSAHYSSFTKANPLPLYVHYMPWFTSTISNGHWESAYSPLIDRYDNNELDVLRYHALLIKTAGIDGMIFDWYGTTDCNDYEYIHERTVSMKAVCDELGLGYAICYEDRTIGYCGHNVSQAVADFAYLASDWFSSPSYLKIGGENIVLDFGPIVLTNSSDWGPVLTAGGNPRIFFLEGHTQGGGQTWGLYDIPEADGEYVWAGQMDTVSELNGWYTGSIYGDFAVIGGALPRYVDSTLPKNRPDINPAADPQYITDLLNLALTHQPALVQLITWNDYGEGTMLEPTVQDGYAFLERVQAWSGVDTVPEDLRIIKLFYDKYHALGFTEKVEHAYSLLKSAQFSLAESWLNDL